MSEMSNLPHLDEADSLPSDGPTPSPVPLRKPRLAIMGEFSAGKSTLSNLLLGARPLTERVTATRLSPVWLSFGTTSPEAVSVDGSRFPVAIEDFDLLDVDTTRYVAMSLESPLLEHCDLIDFPGISDPNMDSDVWERMLPEVDLVLWCTHATQAWRQSEAAAWALVPEVIRSRSMLLITRFDKLVTERDKARVLARLASETEGLFAGTYPLALLQALKATQDEDQLAWEASGAKTFSKDLHLALARLDPNIPVPDATPNGDPTDNENLIQPDESAVTAPNDRIVPRRVRASGQKARPRPTS